MGGEVGLGLGEREGDGGWNGGREREQDNDPASTTSNHPMENVSDERAARSDREASTHGEARGEEGWKSYRVHVGGWWMQRRAIERVRERCTACILKRHFMVTAD